MPRYRNILKNSPVKDAVSDSSVIRNLNRDDQIISNNNPVNEGTHNDYKIKDDAEKDASSVEEGNRKIYNKANNIVRHKKRGIKGRRKSTVEKYRKAIEYDEPLQDGSDQMEGVKLPVHQNKSNRGFSDGYFYYSDYNFFFNHHGLAYWIGEEGDFIVPLHTISTSLASLTYITVFLHDLVIDLEINYNTY